MVKNPGLESPLRMDKKFCMENLKMKRKRTKKNNPSGVEIRTQDFLIVLAWKSIICAHDLNFQGDKNKSALPSKIFSTLGTSVLKGLFETFISL